MAFWLFLAFWIVEGYLLSVIAVECKREIVRGFRTWRVRREMRRFIREEFTQLR